MPSTFAQQLDELIKSHENEGVTAKEIRQTMEEAIAQLEDEDDDVDEDDDAPPAA